MNPAEKRKFPWPAIIGAFIGSGFIAYRFWQAGLFSTMPWLVATPILGFAIVAILVVRAWKKKNA